MKELTIERYIDKAFEKNNDDLKRYMGAWREELNSRLAVVAEMVQHISDKVDIITEDLIEIKEKLDTKVSYKDFYELDRRLTALELKVNK